MKSTAFLVNTARGGIVDTDALVRAFRLCRTEDVIQDTGVEVGGGVPEIYQGRLPENIVNREVLDQEAFQSKLQRLRGRIGGA
jgi:D-isomer specific 2-hydroxyacid dehydrogenase-like protein